ncbi:hypothetical protein KP509_18G083800 [Ceratopteris richardii]|uniref:Pentatricopeptide repeat-containing protein n=1 Tax=Ceratopteris richardii TaxID=49495 RepID=A0A8T2SS63_CERRI|nr:hypothetical protein KP509_18G083800 [Ceratopteris richardii]
MQVEGFSSTDVTLVSLLDAYSNIEDVKRGKKLHAEIIHRNLLKDNSAIGSAVIDMYVKCGEMAKAQQVLNELSVFDVVIYNAILTGYAKQGQAEQALECYERMCHDGTRPNGITFSNVLKEGAILGDIGKGEQIHKEIVRLGLPQNDLVLGTSLLDMYAKCGALPQARSFLEQLPARDKGLGEHALKCFKQMEDEGVSPEAVTYTCILKAYVKRGKKLHAEIIHRNLLKDNSAIGSAVIDMYVKCGEMAKAQQVLNELSVFDVVIYNAILTGYAKQGQAEQALECYERMCHDGTRPNGITFSNVLKACAILGDIGKGEQIHKEIVRLGLPQNDLVLGTSLLDMYAKCGALPQARSFLEQLPARDKGLGEHALKCFKQMEDEGLSPEVVTYTCILKACRSIGAIKKGKEIHDRIESHRMLQDNTILGSALVDMYGKCGVSGSLSFFPRTDKGGETSYR